MIFRLLYESITKSDLVELKAQIDSITREIASQQEQMSAVEELIKERYLIGSALAEDDRQTVASLWATSIINDGIDGDFTNLLVALINQDRRMAKGFDRLVQLWLLYSEGKLNLSGGIFPPTELYSHPALYDLSDEDFEYIVNAEIIVNHEENIKEYVTKIPTEDDIRDVFFKRFRASTGLNSADVVYDKIEELSKRYGERKSVLSIKDAMEDNLNRDLDDESPASIVGFIKTYIQRVLPNNTKSKTGKSAQSYVDMMNLVSKSDELLNQLLGAELCKDSSTNTIGNAIITWVDNLRFGG